LDPKVDKRMRIRSHNMKKVITAHAQFATLVNMTGFVTWKMANFND